MAGILTTVSDLAMLRSVVTPGTLSLRLYTNDHEPAKNDTIAAFVEPSGAAGYAPIALDPTAWEVKSTPQPTASYAERTFAFTGLVGNIYGYFLLDADNVVVGSERFSNGPYNIIRPGDRIALTPILQMP